VAEAKQSSTRSSNEMAEDRTDIAHERTAIAHERTDLAYERSRLASDRTTMAYMRTSVSLIGFGFTIYKFFQYMSDMPGFEMLPSVGARNLGMALLILGAAMLFMAVAQQIVFMRRLSSGSGQKFPISIALVSSICMLAIGLLALANIIFRVGPF
jgi:putative membrane protein